MSEPEPQRMQEADDRPAETEPTEEGASATGTTTTERADEPNSSASTHDMTAPDEMQDDQAPLLPGEEAERFRRRWEDLQAGFVDQPRQMVEEANELVGELMQQLTAGFGDQRSSLEAQWDRGEDVSTEDLRIALTRYRSFFNRLLSA
jgi:hypothetical protein